MVLQKSFTPAAWRGQSGSEKQQFLGVGSGCEDFFFKALLVIQCAAQLSTLELDGGNVLKTLQRDSGSGCHGLMITESTVTALLLKTKQFREEKEGRTSWSMCQTLKGTI